MEENGSRSHRSGLPGHVGLRTAQRNIQQGGRNRALRQHLDGRSHSAVERKHQNVSAVLIELGFPYIDGYKPLGNVQRLLRDVVREHAPELTALVARDVEEPQQPVAPEDLLDILVDPPESTAPEIRQPRSEYAVPGRTAGAVDYLRREARNRSLGDAGEALVMDYERLRPGTRREGPARAGTLSRCPRRSAITRATIFAPITPTAGTGL